MSDKTNIPLRPPQISEWILFKLAGEHYGEAMLGDMEAKWQELVSEYGVHRANNAYRYWVISSIIPLLLDKIKEYFPSFYRILKVIFG